MKILDKIKTILFIGVIILISFLISINNSITQKNDPIYSHESVIIINNTDYNLEPPIKLMLSDVLCIDSVSIKFEYMDDINATKYAAFIIEDFFFKHHYVIFMSRHLNGSKLGVVLGHELVHLDQFETGDLIQLNFYTGIYIYKGDTINNNIIEHDDRPYEIDAMEREEETYFKIFKSLYK